MRIFKIIMVGLRDGWDQPHEFNVGMTYDSDFMQSVYDYASIAGQLAGRVFNN